MSAFAALIAQGIRDRRRSVIAWGLSGGLLCGLTAALYPSVEDSIATAIESYPEALRKAFGIERLSTVEQYLSVEAFSLIVPLTVAYFAIRSVARAIPAAEEAGRLDVLLSAPVSRRQVVFGAYGVTALSVAAVLAIVGVCTWVAGTAAGATPSLGLVTAGVANVVPLALFFAGVAIVASGLLHHSGAVAGAAGGSSSRCM